MKIEREGDRKPAAAKPQRAPAAPQSPRTAPRQAAPAQRGRMYDYDNDPDYDDDDDDYDDRRPWWHLPLGCLITVVFAALVAFGTMKVLEFYSEVDGSNQLGDEITVPIEYGTSLTDIAKILQDVGIVEHDWLFRYYGDLSGKATDLQYGNFTLRPGMSYNDILAALSVQQERRETVTLTFPEGTTAVGIAQILADNGLCTVDEFLACANGEDGSTWSEYSFWDKIPDTPGRLLKCEGYLFPDTYEFYVGESVNYYVDVFYKEFETRTADLLDTIAAKNTTLNDVVILASFIQEEGGIPEEDAKISACFHNRLESTDPLWSAHVLQSNCCCDKEIEGDNNYLWNSPLADYYGWRDLPTWQDDTEEHNLHHVPKEVLDVYNTYDYNRPGLPAGAISNPGYAAIEAALNPDEQFMAEGYYFFVTGHPDSDVAGQYFYAKTDAEHEQNCQIAGWR